MKKIIDFVNKYGILILIALVLLIFLNTCGTKGSIERNGRRIDKIEKSVSTTDSILSLKISSEKMDILLKINAIEIAREVVYTNNAIVRTSERPDDVINKYNSQIKELQEKLKNVK
jgi:hypothetical protein